MKEETLEEADRYQESTIRMEIKKERMTDPPSAPAYPLLLSSLLSSSSTVTWLKKSGTGPNFKGSLS